MADNTIAKAYVQIIPTTKGITNTLNKEFGGSADAAGVSAGKSFGKKMIGALGAIGIGAAIGDVIKQSISEGAALEQSMGGIETLFKGSADKVIANAQNAFQTAGMSANEYMETVTSFSASLLQGLGGDTDAAAKIADTALTDMSDNANKFGTDMQSIQNAYQGFAKQNYTMLDNLKLGYGGTKTEMERLLADATKLTGVKYDINNLADVYSAIHAVQGELGVTGTTAKEASTTVSGAMAQMKASFSNVLGNLALGEDISPSLDALASTVSTFITGNLIPMASNVISALPDALATTIETLAPNIIPGAIELVVKLIEGIGRATPQLLKSIAMLIPQMAKQLIQAAPQLFTTAREAFKNITNAIPEVMKNALSGMADVGLNLVRGLWNGISDAAGWVLDKIKGFGQSILNGIKNIFGIHSPSREMAWMGKMLDVGLAKGINDNGKFVDRAIGELTDNTLGGFNPTINGQLNTTAINNNAAVIDAINRVGGMMNMGIYLDGNQLVGGIKNRMDSALGQNARTNARLSMG